MTEDYRRRAIETLRRAPYLQNRPCLLPDNIDEVHPLVVAKYTGDFCWSPCFDPNFVAKCLSLGYLTITGSCSKYNTTF